MIDVFKRMAPAYANTVRKFALDVWYGRANRKKFIASADRFRKRYEGELVKHYRKLNFPFRPGQIREQSEEWLKDQITLVDRVQDVVSEKQDKLDELREGKRIEVEKLLEGARKPEGRVTPVISFSRNMEDRALQMGEEEAFDLATEINHEVVHGMSDLYKWVTQHDDRVRTTHQMLHGKIFSYKSPPTTVDEYGNSHTGNPGSDWGCRCYEIPAQGKPLLNHTVKAGKKVRK